MADNNCPYHADHSNRLKKLEVNCDELDDRITALDKEYAVSQTVIASVLKSLEKTPEVMADISKTLLCMQNEMQNSNVRLSGVENELTTLGGKVSQIDNDGKINIRQGFKNWFVKNWAYIGLAILLAGLYLSEVVKTW